jgi:YihY family inner membrane protein
VAVTSRSDRSNQGSPGREDTPGDSDSPGGIGGRIKTVTTAADEIQRRHALLAVPIAVFKKFGDDQGGHWAALVAYYGFFSLFPLLLTFVSVLGILLRNNESLRQTILESALRDFPVIGDQIAQNIHAITGNGVVLAIGIAGTLWAGMGVTAAAQNAMNQMWDVPRKEWPNFLKSRIRGLIMLAILGTLTVASTFMSGLASSGGPAVLGALLGIVASLVLNLALFLLAYRVLTVRDLSWGDVFPGAAVAALLWTAMQSLGGYYVTHQIKNASEVYGTFALVIGLLVWMYLGAQVFLLAAEVNVVRKNHLWPRRLLQQPPLAPADKAVMTRGAKVEERIPLEGVSVAFDDEGRSRSRDPQADDSAGPSRLATPESSDEHARPTRDGQRPKGGFFRSAAVGAGAVLVAGAVSKFRRRRHRSHS